MALALTSDFPSTPNSDVMDLIRQSATRPRIAWIPPFTNEGRKRFPVAQQQFSWYGLGDIEYCDIDQEVDQQQLARLVEYDVIYLTGGNPVHFRRRILRGDLSLRLRECIAAV